MDWVPFRDDELLILGSHDRVTYRVSRKALDRLGITTEPGPGWPPRGSRIR